MALLVGAFLALAVGLLATGLGLDRDRAFYPTPAFCLTYDVTAAGYLAWLLKSGRIRAAT